MSQVTFTKEDDDLTISDFMGPIAQIQKMTSGKWCIFDPSGRRITTEAYQSSETAVVALETWLLAEADRFQHLAESGIRPRANLKDAECARRFAHEIAAARQQSEAV